MEPVIICAFVISGIGIAGVIWLAYRLYHEKTIHSEYSLF